MRKMQLWYVILDKLLMLRRSLMRVFRKVHDIGEIHSYEVEKWSPPMMAVNVTIVKAISGTE